LTYAFLFSIAIITRLHASAGGEIDLDNFSINTTASQFTPPLNEETSLMSEMRNVEVRRRVTPPVTTCRTECCSCLKETARCCGVCLAAILLLAVCGSVIWVPALLYFLGIIG